MKFNSIFLKYQLPAVLWAICILLLCIGPAGGDLIRRTFFGIPGDKLAHVFLFCILSFFIMMGLVQYERSFIRSKHFFIYALITSAIYGLCIELIQHFFTLNRSGDVWDLLADSIGAAIAWLLFKLIYNNLRFSDKQ